MLSHHEQAYDDAFSMDENLQDFLEYLKDAEGVEL